MYLKIYLTPIPAGNRIETIFYEDGRVESELNPTMVEKILSLQVLSMDRGEVLPFSLDSSWEYKLRFFKNLKSNPFVEVPEIERLSAHNLHKQSPILG